jgi:LuxR family maltose regulon positive regulatory protein
MTTPLLTTKLHIPPVRPRDRVVSRPRLIRRLNQGLERKLVLISAPAGFGKTTLASEWVRDIGETTPPISTAWLSLDEDDNDLARFLSYLVAALRTVDAGTGKGVLSQLQVAQPESTPAEEALTVLINDIAAIPGRMVLVLDDYHLIEARVIHDALTFLLQHLPPQMHLVVATREDPLLPLARLRARGQLTELRAAALRFTLAEAAEFLNRVMGLDLAEKDIATLEARTEGWVAGLHLAALALQGRSSAQGHPDTSSFIKSFAGSHRYVLDYLVEEVLERQPEAIQTFLLQTAILDRLTGPLCDAVRFGNGTVVRGRDSGQATLEALDRANLFVVPLDEERRWYRYHHLFADLLRQRLRQNPPPALRASPPTGGSEGGTIAELHRRASEWYGRNGFIDGAIEHALRSEDFERAADMIEAYFGDIWQFGEHTKLQRWLEAIPIEVTCTKPHLCILRAGNLYTHGRIDEAERCLRVAEDTLSDWDGMLETAQQGAGTDARRLMGKAAVVRSHLLTYHGDEEGSIRYARQALEYLPESDAIWRWSALDSLGTVYSGIDDPSAYRVRAEALEASKAAGNAYTILLASLRLVVTLRDLGRLQEAVEICQQELKRANENGLAQTALVGWLYTLWGEILAERNELDEALSLTRKGVALTRRGNDVTLLGSSYLCLMRVLFSRGDLELAQKTIQELTYAAPGEGLSPWITVQMAAWRARIWLAQDRLQAAAHWANELGVELTAELARLHDFDYAVLARVLIAQKRLDEACRLLERLVEAAEASGRRSKLIELLNLQALAFEAGGASTRAMTVLERALTLAEPGGFVRIFVDEGPAMARLLYQVLPHAVGTAYVRGLLAAFPAVELERPISTPSPDAESEWIEPLSERELEVLQLIAEGLTNREIADRLFLALNTVKGHSRNIYGKLGVHSRTQAIAKARGLGILPAI